jgi:crotonobetainyl-CoA:carnitine CoA-transferase CaiB-like acyl-CoA transferase
VNLGVDPAQPVDPQDAHIRRRPPPLSLGEHTAEILGSLGLDGAEIEGLARDGIIRLEGGAS